MEVTDDFVSHSLIKHSARRDAASRTRRERNEVKSKNAPSTMPLRGSAQAAEGKLLKQTRLCGRKLVVRPGPAKALQIDLAARIEFDPLGFQA